MERRQKIIIAVTVGVGISLALGLGLGLGLTKPQNGGSPWHNFRLPDNIIPSHYELYLMLDIAKESCYGENKIRFKVLNDTRYVLVHAHEDMNIDHVSLQRRNGDILQHVDIIKEFKYPKYQYYVIEAEYILPKGHEFILEMDFAYPLTDSYHGIFKHTYTNPGDGSKMNMILSAMGPSYARTAYPCFDEPAMKVQYQTTIAHDVDYSALSNMPVERENPHLVQNGTSWVETIFQQSPPMSTYLSCFILCKLGFVEARTKENIPIRIYATPSRIANGDAAYALEATEKMLGEYERLFNRTYPLPKYDQVAIPEVGGFELENWGLVNFGEDRLLWRRQDSSAKDQQIIVSSIAHAMVHAWFGNLVTVSWWDNHWLNEGLSSYFKFHGLSWVEPDWLWDGNLVTNVQKSMRTDVLSTSHPLKVIINSPTQLWTAFDKIISEKGCAVFHMIHCTLGHKLFLGGIRYFLKDHAFGVANETDLYKSMQRYLDEQRSLFNITEVVDLWVQQPGLPLVTVRIDDKGKGIAYQKSMLADTFIAATNDSFPSSVNTHEWGFNLDFYTQKDTSNVTRVWFPEKGILENIFDSKDVGDWFKLNYKECGYWRVNYEYSVWKALAKQLNHDKTAIHEYDRSQLLDDAFNLAPVRELPYTVALDLTTYLDKEESFFVWSVFYDMTAYIKAMLATTKKYHDSFKKYYLTKVKPLAGKLGWNTSTGTHEEQRNRPVMLELALQYGDQETSRNASFLFSEWRKGKRISSDIRSLVYRYGILNGDSSDWEYMLQRYKNEGFGTEKDLLLQGLAATETVEDIVRLLNYTKDTSIISPTGFLPCISYIAKSVNGNRLAWIWIAENWNYIAKRFSHRISPLEQLVMSIVSNYNTDVERYEVDLFFVNDFRAAGSAVHMRALNQIDQNIRWREKYEDSIVQWLQERVDELLGYR